MVGYLAWSRLLPDSHFELELAVNSFDKFEAEAVGWVVGHIEARIALVGAD